MGPSKTGRSAKKKEVIVQGAQDYRWMLMTFNGLRELGFGYQTPLSDHSLSPTYLLRTHVAYDNDNQRVAIGPFDLVPFLTSQKL